MDFTEIYPLASGSKDLVAFSPGGHFILSVIQDRVIVRRSNTLQITRKWKLAPPSSDTTQSILGGRSTATGGQSSNTIVTQIGWSCDSEYLFAACAKQGSVHVFKLRDEAWTCSIEAGVEGLSKVEWTPDGRHILCVSPWGLRLTIWSLTSTTATCIHSPSNVEQSHSYSRDGRYLAVSERHKSKQFVGLYDASDNYKLLRHFAVPLSSSGSISLSPNGVYIALWEDRFEYKLLIINAIGTVLSTFVPPQDPGVGIRHVRWHPQSSHLAVYGFEDKIYILDTVSWTPILNIEPPSRIPPVVNTWREPQKWLEGSDGRSFLSCWFSYSQAETLSLKARICQKSPEVLFSRARVECFWKLVLCSIRAPHALCIYECLSGPAMTASLRSVLFHSAPALRGRWNPVRERHLVITTGLKSIYIWSDEWLNDAGASEEMAECVEVPTLNFSVDDVKWGGDGKSLILVGRESFCCAFEVDE